MTTPPSPTVHILKQINVNNKGFNEEEAKETLVDWIVNDLGQNVCRRPATFGKRETSCTCLQDLFGGDVYDAVPLASKVAAYLIYWKRMSLQAKRGLIHTWSQTSKLLKERHPQWGGRQCGNGDAGNDNYDEKKFKRRIFLLPLCEVEGGGIEEKSRPICRDALMILLHIGKDLWKSGASNPMMVNKNRNKKGADSPWRKKNAEINQSLHKYFTELKNEALPFATRMIRDETGLTLRDDHPDDVVIPPHFTMHKCYAMWCLSRGWKVTKKSSAKSLYNKITDFEPREYDEDEWPAGSEPQPICTWVTFHSYWKHKFPNLKVPKKGADTCTDCLVLANQFRTRLNRRAQVQRQDGDDCSNQENELENTIQVTREVLARAEEHVHQYQIQKKEKRRLINSALSDVRNRVVVFTPRRELTQCLPSLYCHRVFTIDMGQNLNLPNFEGEQPGDTYYLTPLTVLVFGVVDNVPDCVDGKERMNAYVWQEFEGDRGANNITSCLLYDLKMRGLMNGPNFGEIAYIADNCGGQNKNKIVIHFLMWLAEMKIFQKVVIHFLVKGHTKNSADRHFNLLKCEYRRQNIYTYNQLCEVLDANEYISVKKMRPENFHNHLKWQDTVYRNTDSEFKQTHVFTVYANNPTVLLKQDHKEAPIRRDNLLPTTRNKIARPMPPQERAEKIRRMENDLEQLIPTGLKPIKQVELYRKWRPLIPREFQDITCPKPSDEVLESHKKRTREKARVQREKKKQKMIGGAAMIVMNDNFALEEESNLTTVNI